MIKEKAKSRRPKAAGEFIDELSQDPEFIRRRKKLDDSFDSVGEGLRDAERPLVAALNDVVGVSVKSVWDLVNTKQSYTRAIPVLLHHLTYDYPVRIREGIVRALTVRYAGEAAFETLIDEFRKRPVSADVVERDYKWALGNAISIVASNSDFDEVVELVQDTRHGSCRDMLVSRLPDLNPSRAVDILIELLDDDEVSGQAALALGKLGAQRARSKIECLTKNPDPRISKEAAQALAKLDKAKR